jgi:hypothetical protein
MDEHESTAECNLFEVTRRTVIETGSTALLMTALPRAALAAAPAGDSDPPSPPVNVELRINGRSHSLTLDPRKGIGELGICGAGASLANAIYNACGARVRDFPVTWTSCCHPCRCKPDTAAQRGSRAARRALRHWSQR